MQNSHQVALMAAEQTLYLYTIIGVAMQNVLEVQNIALPQSILGFLPSEMAQMKPI
jgi:hypothetical protein